MIGFCCEYAASYRVHPCVKRSSAKYYRNTGLWQNVKEHGPVAKCYSSHFTHEVQFVRAENAVIYS